MKATEYIITNKKLMDEWDWEANNAEDFDPRKITIGSGLKIHWICSKGHKWITSVYHRARKNTNCPYCGNKKVLKGYNDLETLRPDLMDEWDYSDNMFSPDSVTCGSNKIANWICSKGHRYNKSIVKKVNGEGCPICNKGSGTSFPEQCFYYYIKKYYPDAINRYKDPFKNKMELDIYIPSLKTGIEYDGAFWHGEKTIEREENKYRICRENGIRLFRIREGEHKNFLNSADRVWYVQKKYDDNVLNFYIVELLKQLSFFSLKLPNVDVERDKNEILEYKTLKYEESFEALYPEIAKEWHPTKNGKLLPSSFHPGTSEPVWWLCQVCGNEWKTSISNRTSGHGCDKCATKQRKITKQHTILEKRGSINVERCLLDWDYEENEFAPDHYTNGSGEIVAWKCHICGYKWKTPICNRTRDYKNGCPLCSDKVIIKGVNDLATKRPDLIEEWDFEKNGHIDIYEVGIGSHKYVGWKCKKCGYKWQAKIYNRSNGKGCPCCANRVVVPEINDLATTRPDLALDWHPTKNGNLTPQNVTKGQNIKIWWLCHICGNEWIDTLNHRSSKNRGCSKCKKRGH